MPAPHPLAPFPWIDLAIIVALVMLNGLLAMSELAIVSARRPRLEAMARKGRKGARIAIELGSDPGRFLSTAQTGITLIGILAGAFSGERLGGPVGDRLHALGLPAAAAAQWGFALVIVFTTYLSLVIGELVPKQFALRSPEPIATAMARPMLYLSYVTAPFGWLLDRSSLLVFRLLGLNRANENQVTAEELHLVVAEASTRGVIEEERAGDHLRRGAAGRPAGARGDDAAHRSGLDRLRAGRGGGARAAADDAAQPDARRPGIGRRADRGDPGARRGGGGAGRRRDRPRRADARRGGGARSDGRDGRAGDAARGRRADRLRP